MVSSFGNGELFLPKLHLHAIFLLGFVQHLISCLFGYLGLGFFVEPDLLRSDPPEFGSKRSSASALQTREGLPVVRFEDLRRAADTNEVTDACSVCLCEFQGWDEIRRLMNCRHIFHRDCLDRWMGMGQKSCPLCRTPLFWKKTRGDLDEWDWIDDEVFDF